MSFFMKGSLLKYTSKLLTVSANKYFRSISYQLVEKIFRIICGVFVGLYVARYLTPVGFGKLNYVSSLVAIVAPLVGLGMEEIVQKFLIDEHFDSLQPLKIAIILRLLFGAFTCLVFSAYFFYYRDNTDSFYIFLAGFALIFQPFYIIESYFQAYIKGATIAGVNIAALICISIYRLLGVFFHLSITFFIIGFVLEYVITSLFYIIMLFQDVKGQCFFRGFKITFPEVKYMLKRSLPLVLSGIVIMIYMRIDQLMLKYFKGFEEVGIYSAALRISELFYFIPMVVSNATFTVLLRNRGKEVFDLELNKDIFNLLRLSVFISIVIVVFINVSAGALIALAFGKDYSAATEVLKVHIWTIIFIFWGVVSGKWYIARDLERHTFYRSFLGAIINILLNLYLIPSYGCIGAAYATLVAQVIAGFLYDFIFEEARTLFFLKLKSLLFYKSL